VAIKRLHPHLAHEPEFVEMFLDEARLAARIHHPNVVPIQEVGESDRGYYLVMDYIEGDTLARVLARAAKAQTTVPYGVTIRVLLDTLAGLHAAHEMRDDHGQPLQIVHRDVSPQNILVGVDGVARVVDFGVARAASRLSTTRSGQLKGKLAYMAPEQARGGNIDRRADLFSLGIVLWEALTTKRLFKGDGEAETLNRVLYEPIPAPSSARADIPKPLEEICMKALARDVDQRFPTAQAFGDELERAARALSCVGSVRDVAECLQQVIGVDLTQQRDAVRAWLARSEPSHGTGPRSKPALDSVVTRVEGGSSSEPGRSASNRGSLSGSGRHSAPQYAVTGAAPFGPGSPTPSSPPEKVSSVSSAVIQVPPLFGVSAAAPPPTSPSRSARVVVASFAVLCAVVVLIGVGALGARRFAGRASASGLMDAGAATSTAAATNKPVESAAPPASASSAPADESAGASSGAAGASSGVAAASSGAHAGTGVRPPPGRPPPRPPTSAAKPPPTVPVPPVVPDDLSHNPYR
jgi:serine/threonine-protein kinase